MTSERTGIQPMVQVNIGTADKPIWCDASGIPADAVILDNVTFRTVPRLVPLKFRPPEDITPAPAADLAAEQEDMRDPFYMKWVEGA